VRCSIFEEINNACVVLHR